MKTLKSILFAGIMALLCMTSCSKETSDTEPARKVSANVTGQWHLIEELCEGIQVKDGADVYLYVNADCTFELYQKSGTQTRFTRYEGICYSDGDRLIGEYSDGTPWGAEYSVSFDGGDLEGEMKTIYTNHSVLLPESTFTLGEYDEFVGWEINGETYLPNEKLEVTENVTAKLLWKEHECLDDDKNHKCDVCEKEMGEHVAAPGKHTCDYCNQEVTKCLC